MSSAEDTIRCLELEARANYGLAGMRRETSEAARKEADRIRVQYAKMYLHLRSARGLTSEDKAYWINCLGFLRRELAEALGTVAAHIKAAREAFWEAMEASTKAGQIRACLFVGGEEAANWSTCYPSMEPMEQWEVDLLKGSAV